MSPLDILRRGHTVSDKHFDTLYPEWVQELSDMFWTPVEVAVRAAQLLAPSEDVQVLDVGSGVGKFCHVGSAVTGARFYGIEQRSDLVEIARHVANDSGSPVFEHGNMVDFEWGSYQAIYLYNPFFEQTSGPWCQIDSSIDYSRDTQEHYVTTVLGKLQAAAVGTRVATYYGFGGTLPACFRKFAYEQYDKGPLEVWIKEET